MEFIFSYHKNQNINEEKEEEDEKNPIDGDYDFGLRTNTDTNCGTSIALWYGLDEFMLLRPVGNNAGITSESQIKLLLSSITIAAANTRCPIPLFIQIREKWQQLFLGVYEGSRVRTNFEMIHLKKGPQHCQFLTGLLDLFKTKIASPLQLDPINVSVQLTYHLSDFGNATWKQEVLDADHERFESGTLCALPFGVTVDPINVLIFKATW